MWWSNYGDVRRGIGGLTRCIYKDDFIIDHTQCKYTVVGSSRAPLLVFTFGLDECTRTSPSAELSENDSDGDSPHAGSLKPFREVVLGGVEPVEWRRRIWACRGPVVAIFSEGLLLEWR